METNGISSDEVENEAQNEICCLIEDGAKCRRPAGNASFSKRIQKTVQRKLKLSIDSFVSYALFCRFFFFGNNEKFLQAKRDSQFICDFHKSKIQSARSKRQRSMRHSDDSGDSDRDDSGEQPEVDFYSLQVQTLRRYKKFYKVSTRPGMNKAQLADLISKHFRTIPVKEKETLTYFIYSVKSNSNKNGYD